MTTDLGPLDWRIGIVDMGGRPTPEFQRRWNTQRNINGGILPFLGGANYSCQDIATKPLSTVVGRFPSGYDWTLGSVTDTPAGYIEGKVDHAPTADTDFVLLKDGVTIGIARWLSGSTRPTLIKAAASTFILGDYLDVKTPSNLNGMSGVWGLTVMGIRTS